MFRISFSDEMEGELSYSALTLAKIFCICPWYNLKQAQFNMIKRNRALAVFYMIILIVVNLYYIRIYFKGAIRHLNIIERFLSLFGCAILLLLIIYLTIGSNFIKHSKWQTFMDYLKWATENVERSVEVESLCWKRTFIGHLVIVFVMGFNNLYTFFENKAIFLLHVASEITDEYYCFLSALLACNLACIIEHQYVALRKSLYALMAVRTLDEDGDWKLAREISKIGNRYVRLHGLVSNYNSLFGWIIVLNFAHGIVQLLRLVNLILVLRDKFEISWDIIVSILSLAVLSLVS